MGKYTAHLVEDPLFQDLLVGVTAGTPVKLMPEPDNPDDSRAIKAVLKSGEKIGNVERESWLVRAMLDNKLPVASRVEEVVGGITTKPIRSVVLEVLTGEDATAALVRSATVSEVGTAATQEPTLGAGRSFLGLFRRAPESPSQILAKKAARQQKQDKLERMLAAQAQLTAKYPPSISTGKRFKNGKIRRPQLICPHCQSRGTVFANETKVKTSIRGSKVIAAGLTGGLSALTPGVGLSGKKGVTQLECENCGMEWQVDRAG